MTTLLRLPIIPRVALFFFCAAALVIGSWACSSSPDPLDPTATAGPIPTNTLAPVATLIPSDTPSPDPTPSQDPTPSTPPTTREWNILGPLDASVTIADFGDFQ